MKRYAIFLLVAATFLATSVTISHSAEDSPTAQLQPTLNKIIQLLSDESLKGPDKKIERREMIMKTITERFDFREMSKRTLGSPWNDISPEQRDYFTQLMTKLLENNYIGQLEGYSGQKIEYVGERVKEDKAQVSTLIENKGAKYPVHYILNMEKDKWMVYDINIEGVSLIRNYRAEFKSIIRTEKFEGLVKTIEEKNKSFE